MGKLRLERMHVWLVVVLGSRQLPLRLRVNRTKLLSEGDSEKEIVKRRWERKRFLTPSSTVSREIRAKEFPVRRNHGSQNVNNTARLEVRR